MPENSGLWLPEDDWGATRDALYDHDRRLLELELVRGHEIKFQVNGVAFAAVFADTGAVADVLLCGGKVRIRGTIRIGGNTVGAYMHAQVFADGVGTGVLGSVLANGPGFYLTAHLDGWVTLNPGYHTFSVWCATSAGIGNLDAGTPSFLTIGGR